jgi:predicted nucleic acid-binding protein
VRFVYLDSSAAGRVALGAHDGPDLKGRIDAALRGGATVVSSRLLHLEMERLAIRLETVEQVDASSVRRFADLVGELPVDETVWHGAFAIKQHIKTLDALHVATCALVPDCALLTSDHNMATVARSLGIELLDAE